MVLLYPSSSWLIKSHLRRVSPFLPRVSVRSAFCLDLFSQTCLSCTSSCQLLITRLMDPHWFLSSSFVYLVNYLGWLFWGWKDPIGHVLIFTCTHGCWILAQMGRGTATPVWCYSGWVFTLQLFNGKVSQASFFFSFEFGPSMDNEDLSEMLTLWSVWIIPFRDTGSFSCCITGVQLSQFDDAIK